MEQRMKFKVLDKKEPLVLRPDTKDHRLNVSELLVAVTQYIQTGNLNPLRHVLDRLSKTTLPGPSCDGGGINGRVVSLRW